MRGWRVQWELLSGRSGCLEKRCFADLVKSAVFETSLSGPQICCVGVHKRNMALEVKCTCTGGDIACKVHEDAGYCLDQQREIFTGKRPEDCNASSDYSIQPAVIEVLTASLIALGLVLEEKGNRQKAQKHLPEWIADSFVIDKGKRVLQFGFLRPLLLSW